MAVRRQKDEVEGRQNALQATCSQARKMQSAATDTRCQKRGFLRDRKRKISNNTAQKYVTEKKKLMESQLMELSIGKRPQEDFGVDGRIILKRSLKK